ncbi:helix-turn-helix domain-containing protein [Streptomyces antarcticus]|uniref:helix-turn-helix domain-containing protein n=1 Tax=Streptomyces antarcticus TaxID=2996458 RepID=UPI00226E3B64|nr:MULTISPECIES: helix-turn-helix transcriptional regulator [unclassified Streptomyces]MCY0943573.1 helix-turn-helix transcriptional regulator [Streptomyces sp. H34-AA3]MCZ4083518.1 helix-turn-helix transcriptional regulator [Streptomyces sp. H34-S5]
MSTYRLRATLLAEAAAAKGDNSNYAIAKRTGLNQTTISRLRRGIAKPAISSLLVLASTYGMTVEDLLDHEDLPLVPASEPETTKAPGGNPAPSVEQVTRSAAKQMKGPSS